LNTPETSDNPDLKTYEKGCLRIFESQKVVDIVPRQGRVIFFLSEKLEHQVLPLVNPYKDKPVERYAMTIWFSHIFNPASPEAISDIERDNTIFVSIPCYRDSELIPTLESIVTQSNRPDLLFIGIFLQVDYSCPEDQSLVG
jgi:hypothetical protein